jgi:hypothetical protein
MIPIAEVLPVKTAVTPSNAKGMRIGYLNREDCLVNLAGDYRYLKLGYYASQDFENGTNGIHPTCQEIMDGYVMPLFLEKARRGKVPVPNYYISNGYFEPPVIVDTVNPFMSRHSIVMKAAAQERVAKSLTRNFTYAVCCQELPPGARVGYFRAILGWSPNPRLRSVAQSVWEVFRIPLARVRVVVMDDGQALLSGLQPLPYEKLSERERAYVEKAVRWRT